MIGRLHVLTDFKLQQRFSHAELARLAIDGGADTIQFRHKAGCVRHALHQAQETRTICRDSDVPLIVDDQVAVMLSVEADGLHLGQTDFPIPEARQIVGPDCIIGATATTTELAVRAEREGADYIGFGPVFTTRSKANPASTKGLAGLEAVCASVGIPVVAIAGMRPERVRATLEAGAHGIAVMSYVTTADDPSRATRALRDAIDDATS